MAIKVLMIDFYGTLVREDEQVTRDICRHICETSPLNIVPADVAQLWWTYMNQSYRACKGENFLPLCEIQQGILEELCAHFQSKAQPEELYASVLQSWQKPAPYEDMRAFLSKLPLEICLVTNSDEEVLRNALGFVQLRFDHVLCSESARCYKPAPEFFSAALSQMKVSPEEVLFVGDSLIYDMEPARRAGMHTAWINRSGRPGNVPVDKMFSGLMGLKRLIVK